VNLSDEVIVKDPDVLGGTPVFRGTRVPFQALRYYWLMLAESHLTRRLFGSMVRRIGALTVATG
jgi:hypothetical protein